MSLSSQESVAARIAARVPLVHYPAGQAFRAWLSWPVLESRAARGEPASSSSRFADLRQQHVFFYAGPSCFVRRACLGNAAMYLAPTADKTAEGEVSPFDSGALEPPDPHFQPWASLDESARWEFLTKHTIPLHGWRDRFCTWLCACYDEPARYLETTEDRYASGLPDRTDPAEIRAHNGPDGRARYGANGCGDRRVWTWEVRIKDTVKWREHLSILHVRPEDQEMADELIATLQSDGVDARIVLVPEDLVPGPEALYLSSGEILREVTQCA